MSKAQPLERHSEIKPPQISQVFTPSPMLQLLLSLAETDWVSQEELFAFHEAHFSGHATTGFSGTFLSPSADKETHENAASGDWEEYYEEDDLGYYEDGVKRTLTDEQIEIFRHSELEALRRQQEKASKSSERLGSVDDASSSNHDALALQQGTAEAFGSDAGKRKKKKGSKRPRAEPKPDLRKRTWDVVEAGLDTLDYD
jgi:hypothetical protein